MQGISVAGRWNAPGLDSINGIGRRLNAFTTAVMQGPEEQKRKQEEEEERVKREQEVRERMAKEAKEKEELKKRRREWAAMWNRPGCRPLAEPLILDEEWFFREHVPSDLRFQRLFPEHYEKICKAKDLIAERYLLGHYTAWAHDMYDDPEMDDPRMEFYAGLSGVTMEDYFEVKKEAEELLATATKLGIWEFNNLDNDGKTTKIKALLMQDGDAVFAELGDEAEEARKRYGKLLPSQLERFQHKWIDFVEEKGKEIEDTTRMVAEMLDCRSDNDLLTGWGKEVDEKYRHLVPSPIARFNHRYFKDEESMAQLKESVTLLGDKFFSYWEEEVRERYSHLIPGDRELERFQHLELDLDGGTRRLEEIMMRVGFKCLRSWGPDIKAKYSHLVPPCHVRFEHMGHVIHNGDGSVTVSDEFMYKGKRLIEADDSYTDEEKAILLEKYMKYVTDLQQLEYLYIDRDTGSTKRLQEYFEKTGREAIRNEWGDEVIEEWGHFCLTEGKPERPELKGKWVFGI